MENVVKSHIERIVAASQENRLVIFVGAGVSANSGVPTWAELIHTIKKDLPDSLQCENDALKIVQLYRELFGENAYHEKIKGTLKHGQCVPNEIHRAIFALNPCHVITTNYDNLLEQAAADLCKRYQTIRKDEDLPDNRGEKMIIKMHGDFDSGNIVLSENDYFDYSRNFPLIESFVLSLFSSKLVLFVGFSFNDINLKYILRSVNTMLQGKMQRMYLLSNSQPDSVLQSYYQSKGICILNIDNEQFGACSQGDCLNNQLRTIQNYVPYADNIIILASSFSRKYEDQISYFGPSCLKYIVPRHQRRLLVVNDGHIFFSGNNELGKLLKSKLVSIYRLYGQELRGLLLFLSKNQITHVAHQKIPVVKSKDKLEPVYEYFYSLDFKKFNVKIQELRKHGVTCTRIDLQIPYALCQIGRYQESFELFKNLSSQFWEKKKFILYFICMYNVKTLARYIPRIDFTHGYDSEEYDRIDSEIDIDQIIDEIPLSKEMKSLFRDVCSFKLWDSLFLNASQSQLSITNQRKSAENGGFSYNRNIYNIQEIFNQVFYFFNENCILIDVYSKTEDIFKTIASGIIDSIMTPEDAHPQTKQFQLSSQNVLLFIFHISPKELEKIISTKVNRKIPVADGFVQNLQLLLDNLSRAAITETEPNLNWISSKQASDYLKNIILMCTSIEKCPNLDNVYGFVIDNWNVGRFCYWINPLARFLEVKEPSPEEAIRIIEKIMNSNVHEAYSASYYISDLAKYALKGEKTLYSLGSVEQIKKEESLLYTASFCNVSNECVKKEIVDYVRTKASSLLILALAEKITGVEFLTPDLLNKLGQCFGETREWHFSHPVEDCCILLRELVKKGRKDLVSSIKELERTNRCLCFMNSPLEFDNVDEVEPLWLCSCDDDMIKELLKREVIKGKVKKYILDKGSDNVLVERFVRLI